LVKEYAVPNFTTHVHVISLLWFIHYK